MAAETGGEDPPDLSVTLLAQLRIDEDEHSAQILDQAFGAGNLTGHRLRATPAEQADVQESRTNGALEGEDANEVVKDVVFSVQEAYRPKTECLGCGQLHPTFGAVHLNCNHDFCGKCITIMFEAATVNEGSFSPRCCREPVALGQVEHFLDDDALDRFTRKALEWQTPNRLYCFDPDCATFISPMAARDDGSAPCPECLKSTCVVCKSDSHRGDCPEDKDLQELKEVAQEEGWQRCPRCKRFVELTQGCHHITYVYASSWLR